MHLWQITSKRNREPMAQLELKAELRPLGTIIKGERLRVPKYQRSYAWKQQHIEAYFNDLAGAIQEDEPEYFLGSIVLAGGDGDSLEVVDGQQRIATTIILVSAVRNYLAEAKEDRRAQTI